MGHVPYEVLCIYLICLFPITLKCLHLRCPLPNLHGDGFLCTYDNNKTLQINHMGGKVLLSEDAAAPRNQDDLGWLLL